MTEAFGGRTLAIASFLKDNGLDIDGLEERDIVMIGCSYIEGHPEEARNAVKALGRENRVGIVPDGVLYRIGPNVDLAKVRAAVTSLQNLEGMPQEEPDWMEDFL